MRRLRLPAILAAAAGGSLSDIETTVAMTAKEVAMISQLTSHLQEARNWETMSRSCLVVAIKTAFCTTVWSS
jgi:hypothetical protein